MAQKNRVRPCEEQTQYIVSSQKPDDAEWDAFVKSCSNGHYVQTSPWANLKNTIGWKDQQITVREQGKIVAGVQLLFHPIPVLGNVLYAIKGPLNPGKIEQYDQEIYTSILEEARRNRCPLVVIQPPDNASPFSGRITEAGFQPSPLTPEHSATLVLDLTQDIHQLLAGMKRQTRQNVRRAEKEGICIREGTEADLLTFYQLHCLTSQRQAFAPYPRAYIETLWQTFSPENHITLLLAEYQETVISALLLICFGETIYAYLLGWSGSHKEMRPNEALFWGAIQWAKAHQFHFFDFGGINPQGAKAILVTGEMPDAIKNTPDFLKYGFGGEITFYPQAHDYLPNPLFNLVYRQFMKKIGGYNSKSTLFHKFREILIRQPR